jgi:restriction system protein
LERSTDDGISMKAISPDPASSIHTLFVGRERELDILQRELVGPTGRTVWISGPRGIGKTSLVMMFAKSQQAAFPGGVVIFGANRLESLPETVAHYVPRVSGPRLLIIDDAQHRSQELLGQELAAVRRLHPDGTIVVTSQLGPPQNDIDLQLRLEGLAPSEFRVLLQKRLEHVVSPELVDELSVSLGRHPLVAAIATDMLMAGRYTPRELLDGLSAFTWPGIVGPQGETLAEETPEHRRVVSDVVAVSDEFLRKLYENPRLLYDLTPRGFEELVAELLGRLDYDVELTPASKDGGKDIYAAKRDHLGTFLYIVECKRYAPDHPVGVGLVRQLNGVVQAEQATAGILATTSFFTKGAEEFQKTISSQLSLKDYVGIQDWLETVLKRKASEQRHAGNGALLPIASRSGPEEARDRK